MITFLFQMHDFEYSSATSEVTLQKSLDKFYETSNAPKLLEVFTPKNKNDIILKEYFKSLE